LQELTPEQWRAYEAGELTLAEIDAQNETQDDVPAVPPDPEPADAFEFCVPGKPVTWKRTRSGRHGGRYTPKVCREYRDLIQRHARKAGLAEFKGVVRMRLDVYLGKGRRGDVDNYAKAYLDALEGMAYGNDRLVADLRVVRHYKTERDDCVIVRIECIDDEVTG
jgi:crossover junction endodeoxyribonuclease RusA